MAAHDGPILPSRAVDRPGGSLRRGSPRHQMEMGTAMLLAGGLAIALVILVPPPDVVLSNPQFFPADCDVQYSTRTVTATFTLTNRGAIGAAMEVDLLVDGSTVTSGNLFEVPAKSSVRGTVAGLVHDCESHTYSLWAFYPASSGF